MLPKQPQSIIKLFFNSLKAYKKVFVSILPIVTLMAVIISIIFYLLAGIFIYTVDNVKISPLQLLVIPLAVFLGSLIFNWIICFIYKILVDKKIDYKSSLVIAIKKILPTLILTLLTVVSVFLIVGLSIFLSVSINTYKLLNILVIIMLAFSIIIFYSFYFFSSIEIVVNDREILFAIKRAARILCKFNSIWRIFAMLLLTTLFFVFLSALLIIIFLCLKYLLHLSAETLLMWMVQSGVIIFLQLLIQQLIFAFMCINNIYLYNDLLLRN